MFLFLVLIQAVSVWCSNVSYFDQTHELEHVVNTSDLHQILLRNGYEAVNPTEVNLNHNTLPGIESNVAEDSVLGPSKTRNTSGVENKSQGTAEHRTNSIKQSNDVETTLMEITNKGINFTPNNDSIPDNNLNNETILDEDSRNIPDSLKNDATLESNPGNIPEHNFNTETILVTEPETIPDDTRNGTIENTSSETILRKETTLDIGPGPIPDSSSVPIEDPKLPETTLHQFPTPPILLNVTTEGVNTSTMKPQLNGATLTSFFTSLPWYYYLIILISLLVVGVAGMFYIFKRRRTKLGYTEPVENRRRNSTPSWVFSEPDFIDEEVVSHELVCKKL